MTQRTGSADLPLHGGRVPPWLAERMAKLGAIITEAVVIHYGRAEFLRRLANPFWFQSFGAVMGMDWHSSGITTSVLGALKRGLTPMTGELGLYVCGGRGKHSRKTPEELLRMGDATGVDGAALGRTSKLIAKIDSAAVQDGFGLYLHGFVVAADGAWTVVQQGLNDRSGTARRYHWLSEGLDSFLDDPHQAIEGRPGAAIVNLADARAESSRAAQLDLLGGTAPEEIARLSVREVKPPPAQALLPHLVMPAHHDVRSGGVVNRRLVAALAAAADRAPQDFADVLLTPGVGARTVEALAMVAEVVHGAPCRFSDPARFSFAHGGKDRHPFPVPVKVYDETIRVMKSAVMKARLGRSDELWAIKRLDDQARALEGAVEGPSTEAVIGRERVRSHEYGGRSVFGWEPPVVGEEVG